jgi:hypothetical protein
MHLAIQRGIIAKAGRVQRVGSLPVYYQHLVISAIWDRAIIAGVLYGQFNECIF